jgi:choline dehydrogenase-like flavoprotein
MHNFKVLIIGAGLGGLTLAQSLVRAGIDVEVFERDKSPFDRPQGYRLHLDADAINAAREVLSPEVREVFEATSQWTEPYTTILGTDLSVIKRVLTDDEHGEAVWPEHDARRTSLRIFRTDRVPKATLSSVPMVFARRYVVSARRTATP